MITKDEIQELLHSTETYRVERTTSTDARSKSRGQARLDYALQGGRRREPAGDMDKFQEAICAFANDLPNSRKNGYLILGAFDNGELSGLKVTDDLLKKIAAIRSNGNILPIPVNRGVGQVQTDLKENGNQPAEFNVNLITAFKVEVKVSQSYTNENGGKTGGKVGGDVALIEMTDIQKSIIDLIGADASISIDQMAVKMAVKKRTLEREIANMKQKGYISRTGSPRSGKWEVIIPYNCFIEIV